MGIDGTKIIDSDFAWDIHDDFFERFDRGTDPQIIKTELIEEYEGEILSLGDREIFLAALAECLWSVGQTVEDLSAQIRAMIELDSTAEFWGELYLKRKPILKRFVAKLRKPKKTPLVPKKKRNPKRRIFEEGDYLVFTKRNGKRVPAIIWCVDLIDGLWYVFVFPNLTRTNDSGLILKFLDTTQPISNQELATFFTKRHRARCVAVAHQAVKEEKARFHKFGSRPFDFRIWEGSSFGSCSTFACLETYADEGGSRAFSPSELAILGLSSAD